MRTNVKWIAASVVMALGIHGVFVGGMKLLESPERADAREGEAMLVPMSRPPRATNAGQPGVFDRMPADRNESSEVIVRFPDASHGASEDFLSNLPGENTPTLGSQKSGPAGSYDAMGVGAGGGGMHGRRLGGRQAGNVEIPEPAGNTEEYSHINENGYEPVSSSPLSTFSIDVDTASYANVRRFLNEGRLPPKDAVRIEELLNNFTYADPAPEGDRPFSVSVEMHPAPWDPTHRLVRIGLQGREIPREVAPAANLVFLVDVSGSMNGPDRLPLVKTCLNRLVENLRDQDRVALVTYAGSSAVVLDSTPASRREEITAAISRLGAGGSTNGAGGIMSAYRVAQEHFLKDGINRVILCTDGDFNVGVTSEGGLVGLIEEKRKTGVFLSVLGFGRGNYADARMQALADKGNGNASYIDSEAEGKRVLVEQMMGTLMTIAKDVKIQVEFNPAKVAEYRLIGYENRRLAARDFNDDRKDAGEIGAGHHVTALYEVILAGAAGSGADIDPLRYQLPALQAAPTMEILSVKLRFKKPDGDTSERLDVPLVEPAAGAEPSADFEFASAVAAFGMLLRDSAQKGQANWDLVAELARGGLARDNGGHRAEFVELVAKARALAGR